MNPEQLETYLNRIGVQTGPKPTLEFLHELAFRHVVTIPFENCSILADEPIELAPEQLINKLVDHRRGGYCFEGNGLMELVLAQIGFRATACGGGIRLETLREEPVPLTHLFNLVDIDTERWLIDVAVGGMAPGAALKLEPGLVQTTPFGQFRFDQLGNRTFLQTERTGQWMDIYEFDTAPMNPKAREVANWFTSTHPKSRFKAHVFASITTPDGIRKWIIEQKYSRRKGLDLLEEVELTSIKHATEILETEFNIEFSDPNYLKRY